MLQRSDKWAGRAETKHGAGGLAVRLAAVGGRAHLACVPAHRAHCGRLTNGHARAQGDKLLPGLH